MISLFLGCFAFGLVFTVASFFLGALGGSDHLHIPGLDGLFGGDAGGADAGAADAATHHGAHLSPFNFSTVSAFLTWFGGAGYLLSRYSDLAAVLILGLSGAAGIVGGGIIFVTLTRYVLPRLTEMRPEDYRVAGTVARVSSTIRAGGTGEVVYSMGGSRHVEGARSVGGETLERGTEVVILRVERGVAYVERWDKFAATHHLPAGDTGAA